LEIDLILFSKLKLLPKSIILYKIYKIISIIMCFGKSEKIPNLKGFFAKEYMDNIKKCNDINLYV